MNTILISILVFVLGTIIGILSTIGFNILKLKKDNKTANDIVEKAKKMLKKIKENLFWRQKKKFIN